MPSTRSAPAAVIRAANGSIYALTCSPSEAAALLGLGRSAAYEMVAAGRWPTPTTPASATTHRILTVPLLEYAGIPFEFIATRHRADDRSE